MSMKTKSYFLLTIFCLGAAGCIGGSPQATYYHLSPAEILSDSARPETADAALSVGVGPVSFPEVLNRPQVVTRSSINRYTIDDFQRWGGSLKEDFCRTLSQNLAVLLKTERIAVFPWEKHFQPGRRIIMEVLRFDGRLGESARLEARWTITDGTGRQVLRAGMSAIEVPLDADSYEALVKGLNQVLEQLSIQIAVEVQHLEQDFEKIEGVTLKVSWGQTTNIRLSSKTDSARFRPAGPPLLGYSLISKPDRSSSLSIS